MGEFRMPSLGTDMEAGTLVEWRVTPGSPVARGDVVALVETQKGIVEVEIWEGGVVEELLVRPGTKVPVGTLLAKLRPENEAREATKTNGPPAPAPIISAPAPSPLSPSPPRVRASPAARQLARERGVDITSVHGTGPHEAVTRSDVERAQADGRGAPVSAPPQEVSATRPAASASIAGMRKAIAAAMARSKREIPHYYLGGELDVSRAVRWLDAENARSPVTERMLLVALLLKATALALREVPDLNGFFVEDAFRPGRGVHIGVAIVLRQGGLVAPALHDTDRKSPREIMKDLQGLVERTRAGSLRSSELTDATITVTSLGDRGTDTVFGVIYPPQVAIVGFGAMRERPWAEAGMLGVRPIVTASLAGDHRVSDGHRRARLLGAIGRLLAEPEKL